MSYSCAAADGVGHSWMQRNVTKIIMERWTSTSWRVLWRPLRWSKIGSTPGHIVWHLRFWFAALLSPLWVFWHVLPRAACIVIYLIIRIILSPNVNVCFMIPSSLFGIDIYILIFLLVCVFSFVFLVFFPGYIMLYQELLQGPEVWVWSTSYLGGKVTFHSEDSSNWCRIYSAKLTHGTLVSPGQPWSGSFRSARSQAMGSLEVFWHGAWWCMVRCQIERNWAGWTFIGQAYRQKGSRCNRFNRCNGKLLTW